MPTVGKEIAVMEIARLSKLKRPRMYCVARYTSAISGAECFKLCYQVAQFTEMLTSPAVGDVTVLWASEQFKRDEAAPPLDR